MIEIIAEIVDKLLRYSSAILTITVAIATIYTFYSDLRGRKLRRDVIRDIREVERCQKCYDSIDPVYTEEGHQQVDPVKAARKEEAEKALNEAKEKLKTTKDREEAYNGFLRK